MEADAAKSRYWVPMVGHAFRVLELFYEADAHLGLQQVLKQTGITKSSAFRILFTLERLGYLEKDPGSGKYRLARRIFEAAARARSGRSVAQLAQPFMRELNARFGETVNLGALQSRDVVYVDMVEGSHAFRLTASIGSAAPLHASALGKAILAFQPPESLRQLLAGAALQRFTARTITSRPQLVKALERVRQQGFAVDNEEVELGAFCIAAPILDREGRALYGLSVSGPTPRMRPRRDEIAAQLVEAAAGIGRSLALG